MDYVKEVSTPAGLPLGGRIPPLGAAQPLHRPSRPTIEDLPPLRHRIVAYDFGIKFNILRRLRQAGFEVEVVQLPHHRRRGAGEKPGRRLPLQRPRRPRRARLHPRSEIRQLIGKKPIFGICLGNQLLGPRLRRQNLQAEVRPPRRQPAGQGPAHRQNLHHLAEPRLRRRSGLAAAGNRGHPHQSQRRHRRRHAPPRIAGLQRAIPPRSRPRPARRSLFLRGIRRADRSVQIIGRIANHRTDPSNHLNLS